MDVCVPLSPKGFDIFSIISLVLANSFGIWKEELLISCNTVVGILDGTAQSPFSTNFHVQLSEFDKLHSIVSMNNI